MNNGENGNLAIIIGTKAELIKCMPLMLELQKQGKDYLFIHTGQHPVKEACNEFGIKNPDFILSSEPEKTTKFWSKMNRNSIVWFFYMIIKIRRLLKKLKIKYAVYHGDTMTTAAAAIAGSRMLNWGKKWQNVHLEAGLRSGSLLEPFPEEISRQISDRFSDILLAVSDSAENILKEKYSGRKTIIKTGNTIIDSSMKIYRKAKNKFEKEPRAYALINIHRHEHLKRKENLRKIVEIVNSIKSRGIWPLHDNTEYHLRKYGLFDKIDKNHVLITPLKNYSEFIFLLANSKYLVTDGGSIQEESLVFKKPCLILRNRTERQEGLSTGLNFLTMNIEEGKRIIEQLEKGVRIKDFKNPYGEEGVSKKILEILK